MSYSTAPTHNPGDTLPSADWNNLANNINSGLMRMIADTTLSVSAASIDFTSIPQTFAHLMLVLNARGDTAAATVGAGMRWNNDSSAGHYTWETLTAIDTTVSSIGGGGAATSFDLGLIPAATSGAGGSFGSVVAWMMHYASTIEHPFVGINSCAPGSTGISVKLLGGQSPNIGAAISRVTVFPSAGNFVAGSRATLYGMPQ